MEESERCVVETDGLAAWGGVSLWRRVFGRGGDGGGEAVVGG